MPQPLALVLGNEVIGVDTQARAKAARAQRDAAAQDAQQGAVRKPPRRPSGSLHDTGWALIAAGKRKWGPGEATPPFESHAELNRLLDQRGFAC